MDKYQKAILAMAFIIGISSIAYAMLIILGIVDSYFPFFIFLPGFMVIWIPIIARKRLDDQNKKEQLKNNLEA